MIVARRSQSKVRQLETSVEVLKWDSVIWAVVQILTPEETQCIKQIRHFRALFLRLPDDVTLWIRHLLNGRRSRFAMVGDEFHPEGWLSEAYSLYCPTGLRHF